VNRMVLYQGLRRVLDNNERSGTGQPLIWTIFWYMALNRSASQVLRLHTDTWWQAREFFLLLPLKNNFAVIKFGEWM